MLIFWIRKNKTDERNCSQKNEKQPFQKHDECMKSFSLAHSKTEATRLKDMMKVDGDILATVQSVKLNRHAQN